MIWLLEEIENRNHFSEIIENQERETTNNTYK